MWIDAIKYAQQAKLNDAISTEHSLSELMVIGNNAHLVDSYFFNLFLTEPFYVVQLTLSPDNP